MPGRIPQDEPNQINLKMGYPINEELNQPVSLSPVTKLAANVSDMLDKRKSIDDSMWTMKATSEMRQATLQKFAEAKQNVPENPEGFTNNYMNWYDTYAQKIIDSAPNNETRMMLQESILSQKDGLFTDALSYETALKVEKRKNDFNTSLDMNKTVLLHNPEKWQEIYHSTFTNNPLWDSLPGNEKERLKSETKEGLAIATLTGQLNKADAIPDLNMRLNAYDQILKGVNSGAWDPYLSFDTQAKTQGGLTNQIGQIRNELERKQKEAVSSEWQIIQSQLDDHEESLIQTGVPVVSREKVALIASKLDNPMILEEYDNITNDARNLHSVMNSLDLDNPNDAAKKIENLMPQAGDKNYASKYKTYNQAREYYNKNIKAVIEDPAAYGASKSSVVAANSRSEKEGVLANLGVQSKFGLPTYAQKILTKDQAIGMVKQINELPPDKVEGYFDDLYKKYNFSIGNGMTAYDKIFSELHSLPAANRLSSNYSVLASVSGTPVANDLIKAIKQGPALKTALPAGVTYDKVLSAVKGNLSPFAKSFTVGDGGSSDLSNIYSATTNLAMQYLNSGKASNYTDAAKMASKNLILNNYDVRTSPKNTRHSFYIPKEIDGKKIDTEKVYRFLEKKQDHASINNFIGSNYYGDILKTSPKPGETKQLTYYADNYIPKLNKQLGGNYVVTSRYRNDGSSHTRHDKVDVAMDNQSPQGRYNFYKHELNNPLVKSMGTSDPQILAAFKGNPKLKDLRGHDGKTGQNHVNHSHITLDTSAGDLVFGSYTNSPGDFHGVAKSIVSTGFWQTNSSGTGAYLMVEDPRTGNYSRVYNSKGQRYEFSFRNISSSN